MVGWSACEVEYDTFVYVQEWPSDCQLQPQAAAAATNVSSVLVLATSVAAQPSALQAAAQLAVGLASSPTCRYDQLRMRM